MSTRLLAAADDYLHDAGTAPSWNESRYVDFFDARSGAGGWLRIGMRPNEGIAEMTVCLHLPDGRTAFQYERAPIDGNGLSAGGQAWAVGEPYRSTRVSYEGSVTVFNDPWILTDPRIAFGTSPQMHARVDLQLASTGLVGVMGADQDHVDQIFLPGQADWHYQHLAWTTGTIDVGGTIVEIDGAGGKDHSWGPRNWLAKIYLRWLSAATADRRLGFMLQRAVGPTKQVLGGHVWDDGRFHLADSIEIANQYEPALPHRLLKTHAVIRSGDRTWRATGTPRAWLPLRHRSHDENGEPAHLRIVKSPTVWTFDDGRSAVGMCEFHDRLDAAGIPAGLHD